MRSEENSLRALLCEGLSELQPFAYDSAAEWTRCVDTNRAQKLQIRTFLKNLERGKMGEMIRTHRVEDTSGPTKGHCEMIKAERDRERTFQYLYDLRKESAA